MNIIIVFIDIPNLLEKTGRQLISSAQFVSKLADGLLIVHVLPDEMRGIEIETEMIAGYLIKTLRPYFRVSEEVLASGPLICRKTHGAILNPNPDVFLFRQLDKGLPRFQEGRPVVRY